MWRRLYLLILSVVLAGEVHSRRSDFTWLSPSKDETYHPGDEIICTWKADEAVVSPSFQLCMFYDDPTLEERGDDGDTDSETDCGKMVWPTVEQSGDECTISFGVPDASAEGRYTLRMKDDFGSIHETPDFSFRSTPKAATNSMESPSDGAQVPLSAPAETESSDPSNAATSSSATVASTIGSTDVPVAQSVADDTNLYQSATTSARPSPSSPAEPVTQDPSRSNAPAAPAASTSRVVNVSSPSVTPQDLASRRPPSTAAFAVPLSVIGAILVIAAGLAFRHRRKLGEERMKDAEKLALSRRSSIHSYKSAGEVQYALGVLSRHEISNGAVPAPVPLFMPVDSESVREPRRPTKRAFSRTSHVAPTPPVRHFESGNKSRSRPLSTRSGLSSRSNVNTPPGATNLANSDEDPGTHLVIEDYILPSPPLPSSLLAAPQRVHVRNEAPCIRPFMHKENYDAKPLPPSPRS